MFADRERALLRLRVCVCGGCVCYMCECVCPGEELTLAAEVSRLHCEAEVHTAAWFITRAAHNDHGARDRGNDSSTRTTPVQETSRGELLIARWGSFRMLFIYCYAMYVLRRRAFTAFGAALKNAHRSLPLTSGSIWITSVSHRPFPRMIQPCRCNPVLLLAPPYLSPGFGWITWIMCER